MEKEVENRKNGKKKEKLIIGEDFAIFRGKRHPLFLHGLGMRWNKEMKGWVVTGIEEDWKRVIKDWLNADEVIEVVGTFEEWKERVEKKKCVVCGKQGIFWLKLGDFVVGWDRDLIIVCEDCLKEVMKNCVYSEERWGNSLRYNLISEVELFKGASRKAKRLMEEELKRIDEYCKKRQEKLLERR